MPINMGSRGKPGQIQVTMELEGMAEFQDTLERMRESIADRLEKAMWPILFRVQAEAKRRVPVDAGFLRNGININVTREPHQVEGEVGTNVRYGIYIEYGTKWIAAGAVEALGESPDITDAQAVTNWPALEERGGSGQQMPWLRPAVNSVEDWIVDRLNDAIG